MHSSSGQENLEEGSRLSSRSLADTVFGYKTTFGDRPPGRKVANQLKGMFIKCNALNRMFHFGKPQSYKVEA
jgi:hypothetical protein